MHLAHIFAMDPVDMPALPPDAAIEAGRLAGRTFVLLYGGKALKCLLCETTSFDERRVTAPSCPRCGVDHSRRRQGPPLAARRMWWTVSHADA